MLEKEQVQLEKLNNKLTRMKIRVKGNKLYLRGTLPPKPNDGVLPKQYELSTGLGVTLDNIKIAFSRAQEIEARLTLQRFTWADYLESGEMGIKPIKLWLEEFEAHYWNTHKKTSNREGTYYHIYQHYFNRLPEEKPLTEESILVCLLLYEPSSSGRYGAYVAYNALLNFAEIKHNLKKFKTKYQPSVERTLPSDTEIINLVESVPNRWRWTFGIMAAYGLRGHEIRLLDCSKIKEPPHIVYVNGESKTGFRPVYPVPPEWVTRWSLWEVQPPPINIEDSPTNVVYGKRFSTSFNHHAQRAKNPNTTAYYLRDAYAVRCSMMGIDAAIASKWMGHSLQVHWKSYLKFFDETHHTNAWTKMDKKTRLELGKN